MCEKMVRMGETKKGLVALRNQKIVKIKYERKPSEKIKSLFRLKGSFFLVQCIRVKDLSTWAY
jgi:hypothetical protein